MGGSSSPQTVQQKSDPWSGVQPYLTGGGVSPWGGIDGRTGRLGAAKAAINSVQSQGGHIGVLPEAERLYRESENLVSDFTPEQEQAMQLQSQRALSGSGVTRAAQDNASQTLRGDYLYGGPGFNAAFDAASRRILPQVDSAFNRSGRYGSGLAQTAQTQALGDVFAGMYGQERNNQMQAMGMSPVLANQDYLDIDRLAQVGDQRQEQNQLMMDEPWQRLQRYQSFINPVMGVGGSSTSTQPMYRNRGAGALGGAMMGNMLFPGIGGIAGGLLGGLL